MPASSLGFACTGLAREVFSPLLAEQRSLLGGAAVAHTYEPRESVFHEGTASLAVYCVQSGTIELFRRLRGGEEVVVGVRGPGDLVGLRGVLAGLPYAATAITLDRATVFAIPAQVFLGLVRENPALGSRLLARLAWESRLIEEQLVERGHSHVRRRTARFLAGQARGESTGPRAAPAGISMSRVEMARQIGTTPETLSRTLHALADQRILRLDRKEIHVLDLPALLRAAR